VDESETGSANFFWSDAKRPSAKRTSGGGSGEPGGSPAPTANTAPAGSPTTHTESAPTPSVTIAAVHLRPPSIDRGITSFLWALGLGLFIWLGLLAIGTGQGTALILALLSFGGIFLFVRTQGGDV